MRSSKHSATINGIRLHWLSLGRNTDQPPLVMLHGLNDCARTWLKIGRELANDRRVFIPDLPGHGHSERADVSYELSWYAETMAEWMEFLDLKNADLVGHSFGGGIAQVMLLFCRERIGRLVLVSSGGLGREINFALRLASLPYVVENLGQPFMQIATKIALVLSRDGRTPKEIDVLSRYNAKPGSARAFSRTVRDVINWQGQRRCYQERIHEIEDFPPTFLLWGEKDPIIPASHGRAFAESVANVKMEFLENCGHYPHYQEQQLFMQKLRLFLSEPRNP